MYGSEVLAYLATKQQFLSDALTIEDKVEAAVLSKLGIRVSPNENLHAQLARQCDVACGKRFADT